MKVEPRLGEVLVVLFKEGIQPRVRSYPPDEAQRKVEEAHKLGLYDLIVSAKPFEVRTKSPKA